MGESKRMLLSEVVIVYEYRALGLMRMILAFNCTLQTADGTAIRCSMRSVNNNQRFIRYTQAST